MLVKKERLKLGYSLIGLFLLASSLLSLMLSASYYQFAVNMAENITYRNLNLVAQKQTESIEFWLHELQADVASLADTWAFTQDNPDKVVKLLQEFKQRNDDLEEISFVNSEGTILADSTGKSETKSAYWEYFRSALAGHEVTTDVLTSPTSGTPVIIIAAPAKVHGKIVGVLVAQARTTRLNDIMRMGEGYSLDTYLVNRKGQMITESRFRQVLIHSKQIKNSTVLAFSPQTPGIKQAITGKNLSGEYTNYMGRASLGVYRWLPQYNWVLAAEMNKDDVMRAITTQQKSIVWATVAVILLGFIPVWVIYSLSITGPITRLRSMVDVVSQGHWNQRVRVESFQELASLAEAFNRMADKIEKSENEIQAKQSELLEKNRLLEQLAITDPLTLVYNRRYILGRLPSELAHAVRYQEHLATIMIDLDYFKQVNDTYGHNVGDQALLGVVEVIKQAIRKADILGRWGGEEFVVICPNTNGREAAALAERIRQMVQEVEFSTDDGVRIYLSLSLGVAEFRHLGQDLLQDAENMMIRADRALYKAKNLGRNKVAVDEEFVC